MADKQLSDAAQAHLSKIGLKTAESCVYKQFESSIDGFGDDRTVKFTVTTSTPDRERDVLETGGIDTSAYERNPVVQWAHDYKQLPVGRAVAFERHQNKLVCTVEFATADMNPFAEQVYRMVKAGFVKACSIGFRPLEWDYDETRGGVNFIKTEMLEFSICPIPANAEALVAAQAAGIDVAVLKDWAEEVLDAFRHTEQSVDDEQIAIVDEDVIVLAEEPAAPIVDRPNPEHFANVTRSGDKQAVYTRRDALARWNPQLSKAFDVAAQTFPARSIEQDLAAKYCGCDVKNLYHRQEPVYSTRMGAFLVALNETLDSVHVDDIRNIGSDGREEPLLYEHIQLNSTQAQEFMVDGLRFFQRNGVKMALRVEPRWYGMEVTSYVERSNADAARAVFQETFARAKQLNFLKGEAFSLSGEFLTRGTESMEDVFLSTKNAQAGTRLLGLIDEHGKDLDNRGVIMLGPPGNGKTLLGRILMNEAKATFIWCSARDFYYSGGFRGLADAFEIARECAPSIIFIEDVDNYLDGYTTDLMKTEMDGIGQSKGVVTILTTNYPEQLPKALIDRPGRFHDVLRFDLPDASARKEMLAKWLPALTGAALTETVQALHGYSGAHVREFARFAGIIQDQDGLEIGPAAKSALAKLQEQRDLITQVQAHGSRYRAPEHVTEKTEPVVDVSTLLTIAKFSAEPDGPFMRDLVAWKAFARARDRMTRKSGAELPDVDVAQMLDDYGFGYEADVITVSAEVERTVSDDAVVQKRGRVLSKANETKLRNAQSAMLAAHDSIKEVLATVELPEEETDDQVRVSLDEESDDIVRFEIEPEQQAETLIDVDPQLVGQCVSKVLSETVGREIRRAINEARGRLD